MFQQQPISIVIEHAESPFIHEVSYGTLVWLLSPFALLLLVCLSVDVGLVYRTPADLLWATLSHRSTAEGAFPTLTDSTVITLRRSMCMGMCPDYTLKLTGTGKVEYEGRAFVCAFGAQTATAEPVEVSRLVQAMVDMGYFGYSWPKGSWTSDNPTVTSSLTHEGRSYEIKHYHGDGGAPGWLSRLEDEIDRVAGTQRWRPVLGNDRKASCLR
jgi:hypothetical protein